jgi:hypothetical protein
MPRLNAIHIFIRSGVILGCLVLGAVYTLAQTGSITGKIIDDFGGVIADAHRGKLIVPGIDRQVQSLRVLISYFAQ